MQAKHHWEQVYSTKPSDSVSRFQPHAEPSLRLIEDAGTPPGASIIDVGGGVHSGMRFAGYGLSLLERA